MPDSHLATVAANLYQLTHSEGWDTYYREILGVIQKHTDRWISDGKESEFIRGQIVGLRAALDLPAERIAQHKKTLA